MNTDSAFPALENEDDDDADYDETPDGEIQN